MAEIDLTTYRTIARIIAEGRRQTAAIASGRQPNVLYPATEAEKAQLATYAAGLDWSDVEAAAAALLEEGK